MYTVESGPHTQCRLSRDYVSVVGGANAFGGGGGGSGASLSFGGGGVT